MATSNTFTERAGFFKAAAVALIAMLAVIFASAFFVTPAQAATNDNVQIDELTENALAPYSNDVLFIQMLDEGTEVEGVSSATLYGKDYTMTSINRLGAAKVWCLDLTDAKTKTATNTTTGETFTLSDIAVIPASISDSEAIIYAVPAKAIGNEGDISFSVRVVNTESANATPTTVSFDVPTADAIARADSTEAAENNKQTDASNSKASASSSEKDDTEAPVVVIDEPDPGDAYFVSNVAGDNRVDAFGKEGDTSFGTHENTTGTSAPTAVNDTTEEVSPVDVTVSDSTRTNTDNTTVSTDTTTSVHESSDGDVEVVDAVSTNVNTTSTNANANEPDRTLAQTSDGFTGTALLFVAAGAAFAAVIGLFVIRRNANRA